MWVDRLVKVFQWFAFFNFASFFITTHPYLFWVGLAERSSGWIILVICGVSLVVFGFWLTVIYVMSGKLEFIPPSIKPIVTKALTKNTILYYFYLIPIILAGFVVGFNSIIDVFLVEPKMNWDNPSEYYSLMESYRQKKEFLPVFSLLLIVSPVVAFFIKVYRNIIGKSK